MPTPPSPHFHLPDSVTQSFPRKASSIHRLHSSTVFILTANSVITMGGFGWFSLPLPSLPSEQPPFTLLHPTQLCAAIYPFPTNINNTKQKHIQVIHNVLDACIAGIMSSRCFCVVIALFWQCWMNAKLYCGRTITVPSILFPRIYLRIGPSGPPGGCVRNNLYNMYCKCHRSDSFQHDEPSTFFHSQCSSKWANGCLRAKVKS